MKKGTSFISKLFFVLISICFCSAGVFAEESKNCSNKISTGVPTGTYSMMNKSILILPGIKDDLCELTTSTGGYDTVFHILDKKANLGIVQADVLFVLSKNDDRVKDLVRSLIPLHNNVMHILIKRSGTEIETRGIKKNKWLPDEEVVSREKIVVLNLQDLKNRKVFAFGSAVVTARVINKELDLGMDIEEINDYKKGLAGIQKNEAFAMFAMGGTPISWLTLPDDVNSEKYTKAKEMLADIGLASINESDIAKCGKSFSSAEGQGRIYTQRTITYKSLESVGFSTLAVRNELVVRNATGETAQFYLKLKEAINNNLINIRNNPEAHPAWDDVNPNAPLNWIPFSSNVETKVSSQSIQPVQQIQATVPVAVKDEPPKKKKK